MVQKSLDTRDSIWNTESQITFFCLPFLYSLHKLLRLYMYVKMIMCGRLKWELFIVSVSITTVTETLSYINCASDGDLESTVLSPAV
jgi:hypothetical protein